MMEGEWKFKGFYPEGCKDLPKESIDSMIFKLDDVNKTNNWFRFKTTINNYETEK